MLAPPTQTQLNLCVFFHRTRIKYRIFALFSLDKNLCGMQRERQKQANFDFESVVTLIFVHESALLLENVLAFFFVCCRMWDASKNERDSEKCETNLKHFISANPVHFIHGDLSLLAYYLFTWPFRRELFDL